MLGPQMPRCQHRLHDTQMVRKTKEEAEITRLHIIDAARRVFLECGVSHTSLEKIAAAAGVTRGAVYWHFRNKSELFFAMREEATLPFVDRVVFGADDADPLQGIETALLEIFRVLADEPKTRETMEIVAFKCEYVDELLPLLSCSSGQQTFLGDLAAFQPDAVRGNGQSACVQWREAGRIALQREQRAKVLQRKVAHVQPAGKRPHQAGCDHRRAGKQYRQATNAAHHQQRR